MIVHRHSDGSEGYQYEVGDRVVVERTIGGGWFDHGPTRAEFCTVKYIEKNCHWRVAHMQVHHTEGWGLVDVARWDCRPHPSMMPRLVIDVPDDTQEASTH